VLHTLQQLLSSSAGGCNICHHMCRPPAAAAAVAGEAAGSSTADNPPLAAAAAAVTALCGKARRRTSMLRHCLWQIISLPGALHQAHHTSRRSSDRPSNKRGEAEQSADNTHAAFASTCKRISMHDVSTLVARKETGCAARRVSLLLLWQMARCCPALRSRTSAHFCCCCCCCVAPCPWLLCVSTPCPLPPTCPADRHVHTSTTTEDQLKPF
jgi:hypothetical protein